MMFLFGKKSSTPTPPAAEPPAHQVPWVRALINLCVVLLIVAVIIEVYRWAERRATPLVRATVDRIAVRAELENTPAWLDRRILQQILDETNKFGVRDQATLDRFQDPLDQDILREIAANYTNADASGVNHWTLGANAWIKNIDKVSRSFSADRKSQTIQIFAEYRKPAAWVERAGKYYLIDVDLVRLPEEYSAEDRKGAPSLMVITGVDLPAGSSKVPQPSEAWNTDDLAAGLKLANLLARQPFVRQIAAIDMANFHGRRDPLKCWIVLNTIFTASEAGAPGIALVPPTSTPRIVQWGRPVGEEKYYEVSAAAKIHALKDIYLRFNRIDADRDYVDIRTEQVRVPKLAAQGDAPPAITPPRG